MFGYKLISRSLAIAACVYLLFQVTKTWQIIFFSAAGLIMLVSLIMMFLPNKKQPR
ncbi:hypothetical protein [Paenibacillus kobensis]|uniref:hypothetical protein n=1 Tax=Paenibacillus kobensis TaxID=59841 RepID=UPI0013E303C7|nr:hypothetical protein [Paenibacillus kobensis]